MMSLSSRRELAATVSPRYRAANKAAKTDILDEFVLSTGLNRKYAIGLLSRICVSKSRSKGESPRHRPRKYGADVAQAFMAIWRISGGLCPKRLVPFLPELITCLERFEEIALCPHVRALLLAMSISTAERILKQERRVRGRGISTTLPGALLRHQIPIRTWNEWDERQAGFMEIDLVAHCGGTASGDFAYTLTMTDVHTGWTECYAIANRSQLAVEAGIEAIRRRLPFPLLGIDSDNGAEFINHHLKKYCDERHIEFTRCRPYRKNDQCHVEQKNGAVVRPLIGYGRYEGAVAVAYLNRLHGLDRLVVNYYSPSMKLVSKTREGARVKKTYDEARTPWQRLQEAGTLNKAKQERLAAQYHQMNPAQLRRDLEELEMGLGQYGAASPDPVEGCSTPTEKGEKRGVDASRDASAPGRATQPARRTHNTSASTEGVSNGA
jgi:hypothetical protein